MPTGPRPPIPPLIARIAHEGVVFTKNWANIFYALLSTSSTPVTGDINALATAIHNAYNTNFQARKMAGSSLDTTRIVYVPSTGTEVIGDNNTTHAGAAGGVALPNNVAMVVSWSISAYYRGGHPRTYLDGMSNDYTTSPTEWDPAVLSAQEALAVAYADAVNGYTTSPITSCLLGTLSYATHNAWRAVPLFRSYGAIQLHPRIDSQRRRLGKEIV